MSEQKPYKLVHWLVPDIIHTDPVRDSETPDYSPVSSRDKLGGCLAREEK